MPDAVVPGAQFASDTTAGAHPAAWAALEAANAGRAPGYGADAWTRRAADLIRGVLDADAEVFFLASGTAANALVVAQLCRPFEGVVCHEFSHLATDECGAPGYLGGGAALIPSAGPLGKLTPAGVTEAARRRRDVHAPLAAAVSLTQSTEAGTVYALTEVRAVLAAGKAEGLRAHVDGARFANAVAATGAAPADLTWRAGADVLCFGGTKNGLPMSEAVVFFDKSLASGFDRRMKQSGHLPAKSRFLSSGWVGLLEGGAWLDAARRANAMAGRLAGAASAAGLEVRQPPEANAVFLDLPGPVAERLRRRGWLFYTLAGGSRFMCSWATTEAEVDALAADLRGG